jgi:hypothetical protein
MTESAKNVVVREDQEIKAPAERLEEVADDVFAYSDGIYRNSLGHRVKYEPVPSRKEVMSADPNIIADRIKQVEGWLSWNMGQGDQPSLSDYTGWSVKQLQDEIDRLYQVKHDLENGGKAALMRRRYEYERRRLDDATSRLKDLQTMAKQALTSYVQATRELYRLSIDRNQYVSDIAMFGKELGIPVPDMKLFFGPNRTISYDYGEEEHVGHMVGIDLGVALGHPLRERKGLIGR